MHTQRMAAIRLCLNRLTRSLRYANETAIEYSMGFSNAIIQLYLSDRGMEKVEDESGWNKWIVFDN